MCALILAVTVVDSTLYMPTLSELGLVWSRHTLDDTGIVFLQDSALTHGLQCWQNEGLQNVISVANASQIPADMVQQCSVVQSEATPHQE